MSKTQKTPSLAAVAALSLLLGLGAALMPTAAFADSHDHAAPIQAAAMSGPQDGDGMVLSSGGNAVTGNAWCDPVTNVCDAHPWMHHDTRH